MTSPSPLSEENILAISGEDSLEDVRELTLRNHKLQTVDTGDVPRLINLQVMSLSHNMLASLAGFQHLRSLVSLNLNFNALTSLDGIEHCSLLQHFFVSNNRVRDAAPLVACVHLETLHLFRNNLSNLDITLQALQHLPRLRELELAGNPCSLASDYKPRVVLSLELETLDGDTLNQLDYDLAHEYFAEHGGGPSQGPRVDILTLEDADAAAAPAASTSPSGAPPAAGAGAAGGMPAAEPDAAASSAAREGSDSGGDGATSGQASSSGAGPEAHGGGAGTASTSTTPAPSAAGTRTATLSNGRPTTAMVNAIADAYRPGASRSAQGPSALGLPPMQRPSTGFRPTSSGRPGTAAAAAGARPGSAFNGQASVQLVSNELLNDHPLIIEYLAKHVLAEGLALTEPGQGGPGGGPGRPGSSGGGGGGGAPRGPSFAQRLRDTAAAMSACEDVDARTLAGQQGELIATPATVRRSLVEDMVAAATPHDLVRQLVRLCEVLIKEVEAHRAGAAGRPTSAGAVLNGPSTSSASGGAAGGRPGTAVGNRPPSAGTGAEAAAAGGGELVMLRADVERLCKENKALRLENENMFWLAEEIKTLKKELRETRAELESSKGGKAGQ